jgi:hypothetical protein
MLFKTVSELSPMAYILLATLNLSMILPVG